MVAHKATLVNALSRALAERVVLMDFTIGRKGFVAYLKCRPTAIGIDVVPTWKKPMKSATLGMK